MLCAAARAEVFCVNYFGSEESDAYAMLLTEDGKPLTQPNTYAYIYALTPSDTPVEDRLYSVEPVVVQADAPQGDDETTRRVALMNAQGELLTGFDFVQLEYAEPRCVIFTAPDWGCGLMDAEGHVLLDAQYTDIAAAEDGAWLAVALDGQSYYYDGLYPLVRIDAEGTHDTGLHVGAYALGTMSDGLCPVLGVSEYDGMSIYVNARGEVAFDRCFDYADSYHGQLASVGVGEQYGLIDRTGAEVTPLQYEFISHQDETGVFIANTTNTVDLLDDQTGAVIASLTFDNTEYVSPWSVNGGIMNVTTEHENYIYTMDGTLLAR
jgi:hypothetical protein